MCSIFVGKSDPPLFWSETKLSGQCQTARSADTLSGGLISQSGWAMNKYSDHSKYLPTYALSPTINLFIIFFLNEPMFWKETLCSVYGSICYFLKRIKLICCKIKCQRYSLQWLTVKWMRFTIFSSRDGPRVESLIHSCILAVKLSLTCCQVAMVVAVVSMVTVWPITNPSKVTLWIVCSRCQTCHRFN